MGEPLTPRTDIAAIEARLAENYRDRSLSWRFLTASSDARFLLAALRDAEAERDRYDDLAKEETEKLFDREAEVKRLRERVAALEPHDVGVATSVGFYTLRRHVLALFDAAPAKTPEVVE